MQNILKRFGLDVSVQQEQHTGNVSRYFLKLNPGATVEKLERKALELALEYKAYCKPIIYPITQQGVVVLEMITNPLNVVFFDEFDFAQYHKMALPIVIGKTIDGENLVVDLSSAPHALIAGTTGSGKSVLLNAIICSMLSSKRNVQLALMDPKRVELSAYEDVRQLIKPICHTVDESEKLLDDLIFEMNTRFKRMAKDKIHSISEYNTNKYPYICVVIDEFSDLIMSSSKSFENKLCILAQKSRAAGIHIILATQRPSVKVVSGNIKANFPMRIAFKTSSMLDSRVVLDRNGAERLMGNGDGLICSNNHDMVRFKGVFLDQEHIDYLCLVNKIHPIKKLYRVIFS